MTTIPNALAIVADGDTHIAVSTGQYVYVYNHTSLAEGLYTATAAIAENGALSSSNLTAVSGGGLNALNNSFSGIPITSGTVTVMTHLETSGTVELYVIPETGWYTISASSGNTAGFAYARIQVGNATLMATSGNLSAYDILIPPPMYFKAGMLIKATAIFPSNGGAGIIKIA